ncbi:MAG TPA: S8 family serine peptidase, partial [Candidatus Limnocylindria bacterium]|nr:S8 family serine peptidase [Candidatus Limnocylindria bacterium]
MKGHTSRQLHATRLVVLLTAISLMLPTALSAAPAQTGWIVVGSDPALAAYQGGIGNLAATNPEARGEISLRPESDASRAYLAYLRATRASLRSNIEALLGRKLNVSHEYNYALNGFATSLTADEARSVEQLAGVAFVARDETLHTQTDAGPAWMNADDVWDGSAVSGAPSRGERTVAGVIDTGVRTDHPSFAGVGPVDGHAHQNPRGRFYGECAATPPPLPGSKCNNKLIGLYDFTSSQAGVEDDVGHGTHTASTVAGNVVDATIYAPTTTIGPKRISGVAPHANVISYKACRAAEFTTPVINLGACPIHALLAAIDQATADVVDVINFSIGGGAVNPWEDPLGLSFFGARAAGVFVAASAGNAGPNPGTMNRPANSPWLMAVGASTSDRRPTGVVRATKDNGSPVEYVGMSLTAGVGPLALVDAKALGNELCNPFGASVAGQVAGKVVICTQGVIARVAKSANVLAAGGAGMVLVTQEGGKNSVVSDIHSVPTVHIGEWDGAALRDWLAGAQNPQATIVGVELENDASLADRMAYFSSRGPDSSNLDVIKPDVTAPGVAITAGYHAHAGPANAAAYNMIQGTSMSSPHAAGAAALVRAIHRDWNPDQVKSALMSTAYTVPAGGKETAPVTKEDHSTRADAFDMGGGRIDIAAAVRAGFTVSESVAGYHLANPTLGGRAHSLNLASLANSSCATTCSWTRTIVSTASRSITYDVSTLSAPGFSISVSPSTFTLDPLQGPTVVPGLPDPSLPGVQQLTITATNTGLGANRWGFGEIRFSPRGAGLPAQHFPVAIRNAGQVVADCEIPDTVVVDSPSSATVAAYSDILQVTAAGLFPTLGGEAVPNISFGIKVRELGVGGELPPNQHWRVTFVPPGAPSGTSYFVSMATNTTSSPSFTYGTLVPGTFTTLGAPDGGSYDLASSTIRWTIAANKVTNPTVGDTLNDIGAGAGVAQPGLLTTNQKTTGTGSYVLTSCDGDQTPPTPTPTAEPTPTTEPTPTATPTDPVACTPETADPVYFLGIVYDSALREDFRADVRNFEFFLDTLRGTYCIPDDQATILAMFNNYTDSVSGKTYEAGSEANLKKEMRRLAGLANERPDATFFFFLSSHGIMYTNAGWTGGSSECPIDRAAGSLAGLRAGDGESGAFFDCELGEELGRFTPDTRMFVAVD